jgi:AcrR family transcriptional regulator
MAATPKKDALLRVGRLLFLRHGIRKVRVEEICADAQVSKRTFYKYFRDKDELAIAVLGELFEEGRGRVEAVLSLDCTIEEKVRQIIAAKTQLASETSAVFYRETLDDETAPGQFALREQRKWNERVRRFYRDAQARGQIRADIDIDVLMTVLVRLRDLVKEPELARLVPDFSQLVEVVMTMFFYGIVPRTSAHERRAPRSQGRKRS